MLTLDPSDGIKKEIWKIFFNLVTVCSSTDDLKSFLSVSKLLEILIKEILIENLHHEFCLEILMNLSPNSFWFVDLEPIQLCNEFIKRLELLIDEIYTKHGIFPTTLQLYNRSFDSYISPYFWILNSLANHSPSLLEYIKETLLSTTYHKMPEYFGILMIHAGLSQIRQSIQELIFTLFHGNPEALVEYFGLGKVSGLLASKGLLDQGMLSVKPKTISEPAMTIGMSEEEEEIEFENVMRSIEKMAQSGLVRLTRV